ncbi:MAG: UbiA family prenyltransferase [bacterium]
MAKAPSPPRLQPHKEAVSVITCDMEGRIETYNEGAHHIFGYAPDEVIGKRRVSLFSPGEVVLGHVPHWLKEARTKGSFETDTVFVRKDGSRFAAHIRITPTFHRGRTEGEQAGYCGTTTVLDSVDPAAATPKTAFATRIFKGVVIGRLPFLTATLVPILLAAAWIATQPTMTLDWVAFALVLAGGLALHLAANTFNDYWDWRAGTDQANNDYFLPFSGGSRSIELGLITPRGMFLVGTASIVVAAALGVALIAMGKVWVGAFGAVGALMGFFYTAPPIRLSARRGLGELATFLNFGPLLTAGAIYGISGQVSVNTFLVGIPIGLLTLAILWVNEFPDVAGDLHTGKNHLVATLGTRRARWGYLVIVLGAFAALAALVAAGVFTKGALIGLAAALLGAYAIMKVIQNYAKRSLAKACAMTIQLHLVAGLLMAVGLAWVKW